MQISAIKKLFAFEILQAISGFRQFPEMVLAFADCSCKSNKNYPKILTKMNALVSIILPVHNGERFLRQAIVSVQEQSHRNWELIIINDGSTDRSGKIIEEFCQADDRIKNLHTEKSGVAKSLNYGLSMAKGVFIARIDSDDIWLPEKLEYQLNRFQNNTALFLLGTSVLLIDENGDPLPVQNGFNNRRHFNYKEIKRKLLRNNLFCHSSVMFRKELLNIIGQYNPKFKNSEDYEYWIRAVKKVNCEISNQVLVYYRVWSQAVSFRRREEQIYFSLKARLKGFFSTGNVITNSFYLAKFLLNSTIYLFKKSVKKFLKLREDN